MTGFERIFPAGLDASEARERRYLRELGSARERLSELEATVTQLREQAALAACGVRIRQS